MSCGNPFAVELLAAGVAPMERHPFVRAVNGGALSRDALRRYAVELAAAAKDYRHSSESAELIASVARTGEARAKALEGGARRRHRLVALPSRTGLDPLEWMTR